MHLDTGIIFSFRLQWLDQLWTLNINLCLSICFYCSQVNSWRTVHSYAKRMFNFLETDTCSADVCITWHQHSKTDASYLPPWGLCCFLQIWVVLRAQEQGFGFNLHSRVTGILLGFGAALSSLFIHHSLFFVYWEFIWTILCRFGIKSSSMCMQHFLSLWLSFLFLPLDRVFWRVEALFQWGPVIFSFLAQPMCSSAKWHALSHCLSFHIVSCSELQGKFCAQHEASPRLTCGCCCMQGYSSSLAHSVERYLLVPWWKNHPAECVWGRGLTHKSTPSCSLYCSVIPQSSPGEVTRNRPLFSLSSHSVFFPFSSFPLRTPLYISVQNFKFTVLFCMFNIPLC